MKTRLSSFLLLAFIFCVLADAAAQKPAPARSSVDTVKIVNAIKTQYMAIDAKRKTYSQYEGEMSTGPSGSTLSDGYYSGTSLKMIASQFYGENGKTEQDCYVNDAGDVIFIYSKEYEYITSITADPSGKTKSITENWYYFNNGDMIKWVQAGKVKPSGSEEFIKKKIAFKEDFKRYKKKAFASQAGLKKVK